MKAKIGDLVSPKNGRRIHWVGLVVEQREGEGPKKYATECLIQWIRRPRSPAWWEDWSLEIVSESR